MMDFLTDPDLAETLSISLEVSSSVAANLPDWESI